ncbi:MAG TPA: exodeoxyribonuclease VII large subunit [Acidimicrobiales bacterium]|jgi:exodeoxyribonuclease VII large subunit|nr:exodeoxyribonuclease VII large subunit [Acidimicrobiales bacterium]
MSDRLPLDLPAPERTWEVRELVHQIGAVLRDAFAPELWVQGELRNLQPSERGGTRNLFFDLAEPGAPIGARPASSLPVVLWDEDRQRVNAKLRASGPTVKMDEGVRMRILVRLVWWRRGVLRLVMVDIDPAFTLGKLAEDRHRLLRTLAAEGLLDANASRPLHPVPLRVGLVTARGSAAERDVLHELEQSAIGFRVLVADSPVQGPLAPAGVARALAVVAGAEVHVVVVARGGGARTELAAFDDPRVARAVARCPAPVFTGIGHETDRSVADEVAHTACKTPTAAAATVVATVRGSLDRLDRSWDSVCAGVDDHLGRHRQRIGRVAERTASQTSGALRREAARLDQIASRAPEQAARTLARARSRLDDLDRHVRSLDPAQLLARGWSITRDADGHVVRDPTQLASGDVLVTELAGGRVTSRVEALAEAGGNDGGDNGGTP